MTTRARPILPDERTHLRTGFGALLRQHRQQAGYTQAQLGEHAGLSERSVRRFEAGDDRPTSAAITLLALAIHRPQAEPGQGQRDPSVAMELARDLKALAADSLAAGGNRKSRTERIHHLLRYGITPAESNAALLARMQPAIRRSQLALAATKARAALASGNPAQQLAAYQELQRLRP